MAELTVQIDPALLRPGRVLGEVISVYEDGHAMPDEPSRIYLRVRCVALSVDEGRALYLASGIPAAVEQARRDAASALHAARVALTAAKALEPADPAAVAAAQATLATATATFEAAMTEASPKGWPLRLRYLDTGLVPTQTRNRILATRSTLQSVAASAKAAAKDAVLARIDQLLGSVGEPLLTQAERDIPTRVWMETLVALYSADGLNRDNVDDALKPTLRRVLRALQEQFPNVRPSVLADRVRDEIIERSKAGRDSVEKPALAALAKPSVLVVTRAQLDSATRVRDAQAFHDAVTP